MVMLLEYPLQQEDKYVSYPSHPEHMLASQEDQEYNEHNSNILIFKFVFLFLFLALLDSKRPIPPCLSTFINISLTFPCPLIVFLSPSAPKFYPLLSGPLSCIVPSRELLQKLCSPLVAKSSSSIYGSIVGALAIKYHYPPLTHCQKIL